MATSDTEAPVLLTASDVARWMAVDVRTVYRWRSAGVIPPPVQIGGTTRWRRSDIEALIDAKAEEAASEAAKHAKRR